MHEMAEGEDALEVGAGVGTGMALVGNVAEGEIADFTVIGDVVNTTARLQGAAAAGEVLVTEETYAWVVDQFPDAPAKDLTLKGQGGAGCGSGAPCRGRVRAPLCATGTLTSGGLDVSTRCPRILGGLVCASPAYWLR